MIKSADFYFDCKQSMHSMPDLQMVVTVEYDCEIGWDAGNRQPTLEKALPLRVHSIVGGNAFAHDNWSEVVGPLKEWITEQTKNLSAEELCLTDEEMREELSEMADAA